MAIALIIAIVVTGGAAFGAENALPGDFLYPVKVNFNENIRSAATFSAEGKALWHARRAERRLEEAETLAAQNRLDAETSARIEANFDAHAERVRERIDRFTSSGNAHLAAEVSSNFESSLMAHEKILARLAEERPMSRTAIDPLLLKIQGHVTLIGEIRANAETDVSASANADVKAAAENKLKNAQARIETAKRFIAVHRAQLGAEVALQAEGIISLAENTVIEGRARFDAQAYGEAFALFQKAERTAIEAQLLAAARSNLQIEVKVDLADYERPGSNVNAATNIEIDINDNSATTKGNVDLEVDL